MPAPVRPTPEPSSRAHNTPTQPAPALPPWRPTSGRQKLLLMALTMATVLALVYVLQRPHQQLLAVKAARHAAACQSEAASRPADCPGALMPVLLLPAVPRAAR